MNDTAPPPPPADVDQGHAEGPRVSGDQMRDLGRLRRVHQGRTLGGVSGGLGRHFDIDPTIFRVLFVVLVFFGGAGVLLYAALWLFVPDEQTGRAAIELGEDATKVLVIIAAGIALLLVVGHGWSGWWFGPTLPIGIVAVLVVAFLIGRDRRSVHPVPPPPGTTPTPPTSPTSPTSTVSAWSRTTDETAPLQSPAAPAVTTSPVPSTLPPPAYVPPAYVPPPRPRRSGPVLFWPTLAIVAVALGLLGVYDAGHAVLAPAYWALALGITGAMLVVGAFRGRPGGLVVIGLVAAVGLAASSTVGAVHRAERLSYDPTQAADVRPAYRLGSGEMTLNLSNIADEQALAGRTVQVRGDTGVLQVIVPDDMSVAVDADVKYAGGIRIGDSVEGGGLGPSRSATLSGPVGAPTMTIDADLRIGQIEVRHPYE